MRQTKLRAYYFQIKDSFTEEELQEKLKQKKEELIIEDLNKPIRFSDYKWKSPFLAS